MMGFEISYQYIKENISSLLQDQQSLPFIWVYWKYKIAGGLRHTLPETNIAPENGGFQ